MNKIQASELAMIHLGQTVTVRSSAMTVTGELEWVWFRKGYRDNPNWVQVKLKFESGEIDTKLQVEDTVTIHDD